MKRTDYFADKPQPFRTAYDGRGSEISEATGIAFEEGSSLTHQSFKDECDVNLIIKNLDQSGFLTDSRGGRKPQYFDASNVPDYHTALNQIMYAEGLFAEQPAEIRARFHNDPGAFVDFFNDPQNQDEAYDLGLSQRPTPSVAESINNGVKEGVIAASAAISSSKGKKTASTGGNEGGD